MNKKLNRILWEWLEEARQRCVKADAWVKTSKGHFDFLSAKVEQAKASGAHDALLSVFTIVARMDAEELRQSLIDEGKEDGNGLEA